MIGRKLKIIGYVIYLILMISQFSLLFYIRNNYDWVTGAVREVLSYSVIGFTSLFLIICLVSLLKTKSKKVMIYAAIGLVPLLVSIPLFKSPLVSKENKLSDRVETIELTYIAWACDCANWVTKEDLLLYSENDDDSLSDRSIFIEPAELSIELPDTLGYSMDVIRFTGQFYQNIGFPEDYYTFENPNKARVFRYTDYEVIISNFRNSKVELNDENKNDLQQ